MQPFLPKILMIAGALVFLVGALFYFFPQIPLGRLPGDVSIKKENVQFYFPITTSIVVSIVLSLVFWLMRK